VSRQAQLPNPDQSPLLRPGPAAGLSVGRRRPLQGWQRHPGAFRRRCL